MNHDHASPGRDLGLGLQWNGHRYSPLAFDNSFCKSPPSTQAATKGVEPHASVKDAVHDGFVCTVWERIDDQTLRVEFTNYRSVCGADEGWRPSVSQREGGLDIHLDSDCMFAGCGYCIYDVSFTARIPAKASNLDVRLFGDACGHDATLERNAMLPLAEQPSGVLCTDYRPRSFGEAGFYCGSPPAARWGYCANVPAATAMCTSDRPWMPPCQEGLQCTSIGASASICLPSCESDADCRDAGPTRCEDGVCKLVGNQQPKL